MDLHVLLDQACAEATTLIDGTTDNMLDLQTLCSEWTVRELLNHIVGMATMLAVAGEHRELTEEHAREIAQAPQCSHCGQEPPPDGRRRHTLAVLFEYAGTLGLLDLDYIHPTGARDDFQKNWGGEDLDALSRYDGLQAVRITALGRYALGLTGTYQAPAGDKQTLDLTRPGTQVPHGAAETRLCVTGAAHAPTAVVNAVMPTCGPR